MTPGPRAGAEVSSHLHLLKDGGPDRYRCTMVDQKKKRERIRASVEGSPEPAALVQTQGGRFKILSSQNPIQSTKNREKPSVCVLSHFSRIRLFGTPWTVAHQAPLSMGFSRPEYWSGSPYPSPGDLPNPGIEPVSPVAPALQADSLPLSHRVSPRRGLHDKKVINQALQFIAEPAHRHDLLLSLAFRKVPDPGLACLSPTLLPSPVPSTQEEGVRKAGT